MDQARIRAGAFAAVLAILAVGAAVWFSYSGSSDTVTVDAGGAGADPEGVAAAAVHDEAPPTTGPVATTGPSMPKEVVSLLIRSLINGDAPAIRDLISTENPAELQFVEALAVTMAENGRLREVAVRRFGPIPPQWRALLQVDGPKSSDSDASAMRQHFEGNDRADVYAPPGVHPSVFKLALIEGRWKLLFRETFGHQFSRPGAPRLEQVAAMLQDQGSACRTIAGEIEAGKYATLDEAMAVLKTRREAAEKTLQQQASRAG